MMTFVFETWVVTGAAGFEGLPDAVTVMGAENSEYPTVLRPLTLIL